MSDLNHIYFENHSFKSSGSILLPALRSGLESHHYSSFQNGQGLYPRPLEEVGDLFGQE